jgi:serine O-acetyltransferase
MTWSETVRRLRRDRERLIERLQAQPGGRPFLLWTHPSYQCVALQRWSYFCYTQGWVMAGRLLWHFNLILTGADLSMICDFGPGLLVLVPCSVATVCRTGADFTMYGHCGVGGGTPRRGNIGAGPGLPVLGDGVELGWGSVIVGPVHIGDGVRIGALCVVARDLPAGSDVADGTRLPWREDES